LRLLYKGFGSCRTCHKSRGQFKLKGIILQFRGSSAEELTQKPTIIKMRTGRDFEWLVN
jgi:hypothetical protein